MLKKILNQKGGIRLIDIVIIIIMIIAIALIIKIKNPSESEPISKYTNNDIHHWLDNIEKIDNISLDHYHSTSNGTTSHTKRYIKGSIRKIEILNENGELINDTMIENLKDKTNILYDVKSKKGRKIKVTTGGKSKFVYVDFTYRFSELKDEKYKVFDSSLNDIQCIKAQGEEYTIYFDKDTKIIIKIEDTQNPTINMVFKNIEINKVTEEQISVPKDIIIEDKTK